MTRIDETLPLPRRWCVTATWLGWHRVIGFGIQTDLRMPVLGVIGFGWMIQFGRQFKLDDWHQTTGTYVTASNPEGRRLWTPDQKERRHEA